MREFLLPGLPHIEQLVCDGFIPASLPSLQCISPHVPQGFFSVHALSLCPHPHLRHLSFCWTQKDRCAVFNLEKSVQLFEVVILRITKGAKRLKPVINPGLSFVRSTRLMIYRDLVHTREREGSAGLSVGYLPHCLFLTSQSEKSVCVCLWASILHDSLGKTVLS